MLQILGSDADHENYKVWFKKTPHFDFQYLVKHKKKISPKTTIKWGTWKRYRDMFNSSTKNPNFYSSQTSQILTKF